MPSSRSPAVARDRRGKTRQLVAVCLLLATGAAAAFTLLGSPVPVEDSRIAWIASLDPATPEPAELVRQRQDTDCGPAVLKMVFDHYGLDAITLEDIRSVAISGVDGTNLLALKRIAEDQGLKAQGLRLSMERLSDLHMPAIAHVHGNHFVLLRSVGDEIVLDDPAVGRLRMSPKAFAQAWNGIVLSFNEVEHLEESLQKGEPVDLATLLASTIHSVNRNHLTRSCSKKGNA